MPCLLSQTKKMEKTHRKGNFTTCELKILFSEVEAWKILYLALCLLGQIIQERKMEWEHAVGSETCTVNDQKEKKKKKGGDEAESHCAPA